ncbi:pyridoxamine 5'-phosphate oxidase family protein [Candidatus Hecatella orcuttiae]|uniref:pyridoxamine 5'-phosphate oxidase family protein n=1 Tax=Candidatus Hecatella orcuttiae TaxID=1935119 RepID=UPI0028683348|nr:pyridoxamine 5'-phosphate oxidase family protein [Candidatus Hecatella orcuttiae]
MEKPSNRRKPASLPGEVAWLLEEGFFGYLGTSGKGMEPHVTPVIFVFDRGCIYFLTSKVAKKLRNMRENPKVAFLVDIRDPSDPHNNRAVLVKGRVKIYGLLDGLLHLREFWKVRRLLDEKYPKYMRVYRTEKARIPKEWGTTIFLRRVLIRLDVESFVYMREARPVSVRLEGR